MKKKLKGTIMGAILLISVMFSIAEGNDSSIQIRTNVPGSASISNGLVEALIHVEKGTFDLIDVKRNTVMIKDASVGFITAPYKELKEVHIDSSETDVPKKRIMSADCENRLNPESTQGVLFGSRTISFTSKKDGEGELEVRFSLYPGLPFVDIGFSFKNLTAAPVRLRRVDVLANGKVFPASDRKKFKLLNGDSGGHGHAPGGRNNWVGELGMEAENNMLFFVADEKQPRSLVIGGLSYKDFRKAIESDNGATLCATDSVGRRVDPGMVYNSADHFYVNGLTDNPFDALEEYAVCLQKAQNIRTNYYTFPSTCMWFLSVQYFGGDKDLFNNSVGAVKEAEHIANSGFLKYSPVAIRLVPDCYEQNNQQGWWDDEHWQMHGRKERCIVDRHYEKPYETTEKWGQAVTRLGSIPFTYFQPGVRSEDYADAFPGHMLYNEPHKHILVDGKRVSDLHSIAGTRGADGKPGYGKLWQESYDYTDPDFVAHLRDVYANLKTGNVQGIFYDYPDRAYQGRGGMEDRYTTAIAAYVDVFDIARRELGKDAYLQERLGIGSDATLGVVSSVRTTRDNNILRPAEVRTTALRWYKNRRLVNYDMDGKALLKYGSKQENVIDETHRRTTLTVSYAITGRLLLTESFRLFSGDVLYDLSRTFPYHSTPLSARPLDAFTREFPTIFDFPISSEWHQLVLYNDKREEPQSFDVSLNGNTAFAGMGLPADQDYYLYDFWNDRFAGRVNGSASIKQDLKANETRMLSVHAVKNHPQWISTDRHIMQGYVDLVKKPVWDESAKTLSGTSAVIKDEPYKVVIALNGRSPKSVKTDAQKSSIRVRKDNSGLADLVLTNNANAGVNWTVEF